MFSHAKASEVLGLGVRQTNDDATNPTLSPRSHSSSIVIEPSPSIPDSSYEPYKDVESSSVARLRAANDQSPTLSLKEDKPKKPWWMFPFIEDLSHERPKKVCSDRRSPVIWHFIWFHFPSIIITLVLLGLYASRYTWKPPGPSTGDMAVLQFCAKAHEGAILVSLIDILLHRIRYSLLEEDGGIPLGFLSAAYHIPAPVGYLVSWEFWGTVLAPTKNRVSHAITITLILLFVLISIGAAPLSAIVMIPRLQYIKTNYDDLRLPTGADLGLKDTSWDDTKDIGQYFAAKDPFITEFDDQDLPEVVPTLACQDTYLNDAVPDPTCSKQGGFSLLATEMASARLNLNARSASNVSVTGKGDRMPERPLSVSTFTGVDSGVAFATGPMTFLARALSDYQFILYHYSDRNSIIKGRDSNKKYKWKQPLVAVSCTAENTTKSTDQSLVFNGESTLYGNIEVSVSIDDQLKALKNGTEYTTLDVQSQVSKPVSAAFLFGPHPSNDGNNSTSKREDADTKSEQIRDRHLCLVQARWMDANCWMDTGNPSGAQTDLGIPTHKILQHLNKTSDDSNSIQLKSNWLMGIGIDQDTTKNAAYQAMYNFSVSESVDTGSTGIYLPNYLSIYLTDALTLFIDASRYNKHKKDSKTNVKPGKDAVFVDQIIYWNLYAYRLDHSPILPIAFTVLLLHLIIVVVHHGFILVSPRPWHSQRWGSISEMIVLAWRSRAPQGLENTGAGITSTGSWKTPIMVREVNERGGLEIVTHQGGSVTQLTRRARPGFKYS